MNYRFKNKIVIAYCIIFYVLMFYKLLNGMMLSQLQPSFFYTREDLFTWLFMQTRLHQWLLNNTTGWLLADTLFYTMPAIYLCAWSISKKASAVAAFVMLIINCCYVQVYTLYPSNSIEGHIAWMLFPVAFMVNNNKTFSMLFQALRYFFLYLFFSAAAWKIIQGGIFNNEQMSAVLLGQHNQLFTSSPFYWQSKMYLWLIRNSTVSYILYLSAFLIELSFLTGFFTKKYDKLLAVGFITFLVLNHIIMRIPYYELLPLVLTLVIKENEPQERVTI